jgi:prepilin-type N-terminal cleavage/methylation domain-containing protein
MKRIYAKTNPRAFTLIELLVVISIIATLIAIMSIGIRAAMRQARNLRQKAELKAMDTALELFSKEFDDYPESKTLPIGGTTNLVCGAQHLAEALVGRDNRGIEPQTGWYPPNDLLYKPNMDPEVQTTFYDATKAASLNRRKGPYVELKNSGIYLISELWQSVTAPSQIYTSSGATNYGRSPVITDTFNTTPIVLNGAAVKVGQPVLYFKADGSKRFRISGDTPPVAVTDPASTEYSKWIYNFDDNLPLVSLPVMSDPALTDMDFIDPASSNPAGVTPAQKAQRFYEQITQTADVDRNYYKPFNANRFILISAGWDGVYGTKDDITNFDY